MWRDTWNSVLLKEWVIVVFKANSAIFPLYHGKNKLIINEMMMKSALYQTNMLSLIFIVLAHWNNSLRADMSLHSDSINMIFVDIGWISFNISGIMVSVLTSSALSRGFEPRSGQTKIGICCFSAKHTTLRRKSKDWLARNQNNVSEWSDMSARRLLFQWASTILIEIQPISTYIILLEFCDCFFLVHLYLYCHWWTNYY
jgi:hypothetical protein